MAAQGIANEEETRISKSELPLPAHTHFVLGYLVGDEAAYTWTSSMVKKYGISSKSMVKKYGICSKIMIIKYVFHAACVVRFDCIADHERS